ncbi:MAG: CDP-glucose 4,6-dehydratase [Halobacteriota archaeon]
MGALFKNVFQGQTIAVTGDTGFKGSWLAIWLLNLGAEVIGYSLPPKTAKDNFELCGLSNKITHINGDIRRYDSVLAALSEHKPSVVFHLAAQALVLDSYNQPRYTHDTNIMGTANVLEAVRQEPSIKAMVNVTSDKCYENKEWVHSYRETDPLGGKDPYSASKAASEILTKSYISSFFNNDAGAAIASARAGNVIGGGDWAENRIFPDCMRALTRDKPVVIRHPSAVRPWQHVLEPLSGYLKLASLLCADGIRYSGAWNFGPSMKNMVTVKQLVEEVIKQWGRGCYVVANAVDDRKEAAMLSLDISKAVNRLGWQPVLDFSQTVQFAIEEYKTNNLSAEEVFNQRVEHIDRYTKLAESLS